MSLPAPPPTSDTPPARNPKVLSCLLCSQRKIKCDRKTPCSNCVKARQECISASSLPPRRRKKRFPEAELLARLRYYEDILRTNGVNLDDINEKINGLTLADEAKSSRAAAQAASADRVKEGWAKEIGKLLVCGKKGNTSYLNNHMWAGLSDEFREAEDVLDYSSDDERHQAPAISSYDAIYPTNGAGLVFGAQSSKSSLTALHPDPVQIFRLWQTFLDNVNPLTKMLHTPTTQQSLLAASGDVKNISKGLEALVFAIYTMAVLSLDDSECLSMFSSERSALLTKYQTATQQALINAGFLKSYNIVILQALVLYLMSLRETMDPRSLFLLSGLSVRFAQRMGLHQDAADGLTPFQAEIRRRLWWQIAVLDSRVGELSASGSSITAQYTTSSIPLNVNDSDLYPDMKSFPKEITEGITEMSLFMIRCEIGIFLRDSEKLRKDSDHTGYNGNWQIIASPNIPVEQKDKMIDELEQRLETKYVAHCDLKIPFHIMIFASARSAISKMRMVAHHPRLQPNRGALMPSLERENLFKWSLQLMEYHNQMTTTPTCKGFLWHINTSMPLDAYIYLLSDLRVRPIGELPDQAWDQIQQLFENHKPLGSGTGKNVEAGNYRDYKWNNAWFFKDPDNSFHVALSNLAIKGWEARAKALASAGHLPREPLFITRLKTSVEEIIALKRASRKSTSPDPSASASVLSKNKNSSITTNTFSNTTSTTSADLLQPNFYAQPTSISTPLTQPPPPVYQLNSQPSASLNFQPFDNTRTDTIQPTNNGIPPNTEGGIGIGGDLESDMVNMMDWAFWDDMMGFQQQDTGGFGFGDGNGGDGGGEGGMGF